MMTAFHGVVMIAFHGVVMTVFCNTLRSSRSSAYVTFNDKTLPVKGEAPPP
jgi:hypothetical protein